MNVLLPVVITLAGLLFGISSCNGYSGNYFCGFYGVKWNDNRSTLNLAMSLNPIGLIVALVVGLIAVIVLLWNNNKAFRDFRYLSIYSY